MQAIQIDSQKDRYLISIQKDMFEHHELLNILQWLRVELLAQKANVGDEVAEVEQQIGQDWWTKNQHKFEVER